MDKVKCNSCEWHGTEDDLTPFNENGEFGDGTGGYGCPNCKTDHFLMDIESERQCWALDRSRCVHCGSENIDYTSGADFKGDCVYFAYKCRDCENLGREVYAIDFIENQML